MTRYSSNEGDVEVALGWDRPTQSYYVQVFEITDDPEDEKCLLDYGANLRESVQRIDELQSKLDEFRPGLGNVCDDYWSDLHLDRDLNMEPR